MVEENVNPYESPSAPDDLTWTSVETDHRLLATGFFVPLLAFLVYWPVDKFVLSRFPWSEWADRSKSVFPISRSEFDMFAWLAISLVAMFLLFRGRYGLARRPRLTLFALMAVVGFECLYFCAGFANSRY